MTTPLEFVVPLVGDSVPQLPLVVNVTLSLAMGEGPYSTVAVTVPEAPAATGGADTATVVGLVSVMVTVPVLA